jgi:protein-disulfide isomerase
MKMTMKPGVVALLLAIAILPACADKAEETKAEDGDQVVALVNDAPITMAELEEKAAGGLKKLEQERYDLLRQALEALAVEKMVTQEAESFGITPEELLKQEIQDKITPATPEEVARFYEQNKARAGGRSLEDVASSIERQLNQNRSASQRDRFLGALKEKSGFQVLLEAPRYDVPIPEGIEIQGVADAKVTVVEFADYQCPYCRRAHPGVERLLADYGDKIRYVFLDFPLDFHPRATPAAVAAHCAAEQGKYWEYHNNLMEMTGDLSDGDLAKRAEALQLNMDEFSACATSGRHEAKVDYGYKTGQELGVTGTPSYFINGRMLVGARPFEEIKAIVDEELARDAAEQASAGS